MLTRPIKVKKGADFVFVIQIGEYSYDDFQTISVKINQNSGGTLLKELANATDGGITEDADHNFVCKLPKASTAFAQTDTYDLVLTAVFTSVLGGNTIIEEYKKFIEFLP